jgi:WD40-like Beta Propeller Repeat/Stage II sporulation protein
MRKLICLAIALLWVLAAPYLQAQTGVLPIVVRDIKTHAAIQAKIRVEGPRALETETDKDGKLMLSLPTGQYQVTAAALGYSTMTWSGNLWARPNANRPAEIFLFPAFAEVPVSGGTGVLSIRVRDTTTHYAVPAKVEFEGPRSLSVETGETGETGRLALPSGEYLEKFSAPGYRTMWWDSVMVKAGESLPLTVNLVSLKPRQEEEWERSQLKPGYTLFRGYATDEQGRPVAGVRVRFQKAGAETRTNERGYYWFSILTPPEKKEGYPGTDTLSGEKPGYKTIVLDNIVLAGQDSGGGALDMVRGSGTIYHDELPMSMRETDEHQHPEPEEPPKPSPANPKGVRESSPQSSLTIGTSLLPDTIKVGLSCPRDSCQTNNPDGPCYHPEGCTNYRRGCAVCPGNRWHESSECTDPEPFDLEPYVQQGLQYEWLSGWPADSLKAGAVAYRTYAAYFKQHPGRSGSSNYDIRSDECNQTFRVGVIPPPSDTRAAAQRTAGVALSDDGTTAYFSEYALNTNNWGGCGDGYTGDNVNWPCMKDPIATGSPHAGHGRGMSQQGSWWWARGQSYLGQYTPPAGWQCILDHYYNDNGNATGKGDPHTYRYSFIYGPGGDGPGDDGQIVYGPLSDIVSRAGLSEPSDLCEGTFPSDIWTMRLDGTNLFDVTPNQCNGRPVWSPKQDQIAYDPITPPVFHVKIMNAADGSLVKDLGLGYGPDWSQENRIVYAPYNGGLYAVNPDGSGGVPVTSDPSAADPFWSPDGTLIAFDACPDPQCDSGRQIAVIKADGTGVEDFLTSGPPYNISPAWSPDGKKIVYLSNPGGWNEIYIMNSDGSDPTQLTHSSQYNNLSPRWSQDGKYIVWLTLVGDFTAQLNVMSPSPGAPPQPYGPYLPAPNNDGPTINTTRCRPFDAL